MKILIAGDYYPRRRVGSLLSQRDFSFLDDVKHIINNCNYSIVNFEGCVASENDIPIDKTGPNQKCDENAIEAIKYAGFDCVTLANNHFRDFGDTGVQKTLNTCEKFGIEYVGGGNNYKQSIKPLFKTIDNKKFAFINRCESEWSIATENSGGSAPLNPIEVHREIKNARNSADYVIVITHGGVEKYSFPTPQMKELYRFFIDSGADVVVNHHQHCISGYEVYQNKPIFYGLGNFCFDWITASVRWWEEGIMVILDFCDNVINFQLCPYIQFSEEPKITLMTSKEQFECEINHINEVILDDNMLQKEYDLWIKKSNCLGFLEPYNLRISKSLLARGFLPSFIKGERKKELLNRIRCESHRETIIRALMIK